MNTATALDPKQGAHSRPLGCLLTAVVLLLAGCGAGESQEAVQLPHFEGGDGAMTAAIDGELAGDPDLEGGCVWLVRPDGTPAAVSWAFPARLRVADMALVNEKGEVLARVGDAVELGGGYTTGESIERCMVSESLVQAWTIRVIEDPQDPSEAPD